MKLACHILGHSPSRNGWWGDIPYAEISQGGVDGIGRIHGTFHHKCHRCGTRFLAGRLHLNCRTIRSALGLTDAPYYDVNHNPARQITRNNTVTDQLLSDLFKMMIEMERGFWLKSIRSEANDWRNTFSPDWYAHVDYTDEKTNLVVTKTISTEHLERGFELMPMSTYACILDGEWDSFDADTWLQFVLFGRLEFR